MTYQHAFLVGIGLAVLSQCGGQAGNTDSTQGDRHTGLDDDADAANGTDPKDDPKGDGGSGTGDDTASDADDGGKGPSASDDDAADDDGAADDAADDDTEPEPDVSSNCAPQPASQAPLRRLSRFEYDNTVRDLLGDESRPAQAFPPGLGRYGNSAQEQYTSELVVEQYALAAQELADAALSTADIRASRFPCLNDVNPDTEASCVSEILDGFGASAFRRPLDTNTKAELVELQAELRANGTFEESIISLLEAILQAPDFLYRLEFGATEPVETASGKLRRPDGYEMATRLSYLFWGTQPDVALRDAAALGELDNAAGVRDHAERLLRSRNSRPVVRHFTEAYLGLGPLLDLDPDPDAFPYFSAATAALMHEETLGYVENELFEGTGSWRSVLTAPYVFVNEELANYYDIDGVSGPEFRPVQVPPSSHRQGLLTQGGLLVNNWFSHNTSPFRRGYAVAVRLMCFPLPPPPTALPVVLPEPSEAATTRQRYEQTTLATPECRSCHQYTDPIGFALENYDASATWREQEHGYPIDASGDTPVLGSFSGPGELIAKVAAHEDTYRCFAENLAQFGYGLELSYEDDACTVAQLQDTFTSSGYDVQALLLALAQTNHFLYLPVEAAP